MYECENSELQLLCGEKCLFVCLVVSCSTPNVPNGYRVGGKAPPYGLNNFIEYKCSDGYDMRGENSIRCTAKGWSPELPQCIGKTKI